MELPATYFFSHSAGQFSLQLNYIKIPLLNHHVKINKFRLIIFLRVAFVYNRSHYFNLFKILWLLSKNIFKKFDFPHISICIYMYTNKLTNFDTLLIHIQPLWSYRIFHSTKANGIQYLQMGEIRNVRVETTGWSSGRNMNRTFA